MSTVDAYIAESDMWPAEMAALREILLSEGLSEGIKWRSPCFGDDGRNIAIMQEMKGFLALMFFKGALLDDPANVLEDQGPNTRSAKRLVFRTVEDVVRLENAVRALVRSAVAVEAAGLEVEAPDDLDLATELANRLADDPELQAAFEALTPGRRREYNLHISAAKQSTTRTARVDRVAPRILAGKGLRDR